MPTLKEQAIEFINTVPDDKIVYVIDMLKGLKGLLNDTDKEESQTQQVLLEDIKGLRGIVRSDIDEKAELMRARDEKYASLS